MWITGRQFWLLAHLGLGVLYLHGFGIGLMGLARQSRRFRSAAVGAVVLAIAAAASVLTGTYVVYPWYRAVPPAMADLSAYPQRYLLADPNLAQWHELGMEWKEHVAWLSPICATAVAAVVLQYGARLKDLVGFHWLLRVLLTLAFLSGLVAGMLGAALNKVAPNAFLMQ